MGEGRLGRRPRTLTSGPPGGQRVVRRGIADRCIRDARPGRLLGRTGRALPMGNLGARRVARVQRVGQLRFGEPLGELCTRAGRADRVAAVLDRRAQPVLAATVSIPINRYQRESSAKCAVLELRDGTHRCTARPETRCCDRLGGADGSLSFVGNALRGDDRNRTGVDGFAGRCVATPPRRRGPVG